jgi:DNA sulfur modification protein DndE
MSLDHIRLSQQAKDQLVRLKRISGIEHWNALCRWGLCISLAEPTTPSAAKIMADSNVEMTWRVFGGRYADLYAALIKERCILDGVPTDPETLEQQFRLHLHRGISYLAANRHLRKIDDLLALATPSWRGDEREDELDIGMGPEQGGPATDSPAPRPPRRFTNKTPR